LIRDAILLSRFYQAFFSRCITHAEANIYVPLNEYTRESYSYYSHFEFAFELWTRTFQLHQRFCVKLFTGN